MSCTVWINHGDVQVGNIKREIIVSTVPDHNIASVRVLLSCTKNGFIINTGIYHVSANHMRFILFHFFNGAFVFGKVINGGKTLNFLFNEIAIRHRMTNGNYFQPLFHQEFNYPSGSLAFTTACPDCTHSNHRFGRFYHGVSRAKKHEVCTCSVNDGTHTHYFLISNVAV